jgi:hypothetical protein
MNRMAWRVLTLLSVSLGLALLSPAVAADDVAKANSLLDRAQVNLDTVNASVGNRTSPPRGSAGKLAAQRLQQAFGDLQPAGQIVQSLPADGEGVAELTQRYQQSVELYQKLGAILNGGQAPAPADTGGTRLNYQQEDSLKDARFHLREAEGLVQGLQELMAQTQTIDDKNSIDYRTVAAAMQNLETVGRRLEPIRTRLEALPADGAGVPPAVARYNAVLQAGQTLSQYFPPLHQQLQALINPASYPQLDADLRRLQELTGMYRDPGLVSGTGEDVVATIKLAGAAKQEVFRMARRYGELLKQPAPLAERIEKSGNYFLQKHADFMAAVAQRREELPGEIRGHLASARQDMQTAVAEQKPGYFNGGIPQKTGWATDKLAVLEAIDPEAAAPLATELHQFRQELKQQAASLRELIIRENQPPPDRFFGEDRQKAIDTAIDAWTYQEEDFEVLGARIPAEAWDRQVRQHFDGELDLRDGDLEGTWSKTDRSRLQVQLLIAVKDQPTLAKIIPVNVTQDHMKGDTLTGSPMFAGDEELPPRFFLLRDKIR